jgi:hypothetical protein
MDFTIVLPDPLTPEPIGVHHKLVGQQFAAAEQEGSKSLRDRQDRRISWPALRIVDPGTGRSYVKKRRVRYNEPGQPRELTFSCYNHYAFLGRDRTREWFCDALGEARRR